jgi:hypothetical protein
VGRNPGRIRDRPTDTLPPVQSHLLAEGWSPVRTLVPSLGIAALAAVVSAAPLLAQPSPDPCAETPSRRDYLTVEMEPTGRVPGVGGCARLAVEWSPFGIAVTPDGHVRYRIELFLRGLDRRRVSEEPAAYVAWAVSSDLEEVYRIGILEDGYTRGSVWLNQYLVVVTAEADPETEGMNGPIVARGRSPTGWIEPFQHHDPYNTGMPVRPGG